jgi:two-component system sensor histidine kinase KdpD
MNTGRERPDPDELLQQVTQDEVRARRGRLKIFFGASAGVGKTWAMLAAARTSLAQGRALVIGLVETHGRHDTERMAEGLPRLPLRQVTHRECTLQEFDLDAALAFGQTHDDALVLVDELAHSNAPGSRHPKRWQDVEELLQAGVDVWSTMNVQHLESLNDVVSGITGIRVWETVPDRLFDEADEVVVVDLPPDELLARLKAGKVYLPDQAERAAGSFFRKGNLLALRELALRRTADRVDEQVLAYRKRASVDTVWPNRESLLACVGSGMQGDKVVRSCARLAAQLDVSWHAVHIEPVAGSAHDAGISPQVDRALKLAAQLGATTAVRPGADVAQALVRYAREHNLVRLVMGRHGRRWPWDAALSDRIADMASDIDVLQVSTPAAMRTAPLNRASSEAPPDAERPGIDWVGHGAAAVACVFTALLSTPLLDVLELSNIVMLFLLTVVAVGLRFGRGPALTAAFLGVGVFDFFFVPPRFSFAVSDVQYLVTFAVMLAVALTIGQLTAVLKVQAESALRREQRVRSLYEMARDLSSALMVEQVSEIAQRFLDVEFHARGTLLVADDAKHLQPVPGGGCEVDMAVAHWAFSKERPAGMGTDTLPASPTLVLPLKAPMRPRGALVILPPVRASWDSAQLRLLETCASLLAISLERIHYIEVAQATTLQIESERLRNSLLSAISHDLRTPLSGLVGMADALEACGADLPSRPREIAATMRQSALRMGALVHNLLDMARLEAGAVQLNRQWQPLEEIVGSALAACQPALEGHPIEVQLNDDLPLLHLDAVLIERVLVNLLENASKYTPTGSLIELHASCTGAQVTIFVADRGPGLPPGREESLFQKFERGNRESALPGVGLGLAICRAIVQAHGGHIHAENRDGGGARFVIALPIGTPPGDDGSTAVDHVNAPTEEESPP